MAVSSKDVAQKKFTVGFGSGYKKDEVDDYMKQLEKQLRSYENVFREFKKHDYKRKAELYDSSKDEISKIMLNAQSQAEKIKQDTDLEIATRKREAEVQINQMVTKAQAEAQKLVDEAKVTASDLKAQATKDAEALLASITKDCEVLQTGFDATKIAVQAWNEHVVKLTGELLGTLQNTEWNNLLHKDLEVFIPETIETRELPLAPNGADITPLESEAVEREVEEALDPLAQLAALENKAKDPILEATELIKQQEQQFLGSDANE